MSGPRLPQAKKRGRRGRRFERALLVVLSLLIAALTLGLLARSSAAGRATGTIESNRAASSGSAVEDSSPRPDDSGAVKAGVNRLASAAPAAAMPMDLHSTSSRIARGLLPLHVLVLPEASTGALLMGAEDNHLLRIESRPERLSATSDEIYVAIGKAGANKQREGDEKTPIGVYWVQDFIPGERLPEIYGEGAYPISYPNLWDRRLGRTGSGIWIHGTNKPDDELLPRSSRGCLTLRNQDFLDLGGMVLVDHTAVVIAEKIKWVPREVFQQTRQGLLGAVERWRRDWESLDTQRYLTNYAQDFRAEGMNLERWSAHKRRVNAQKAHIEVELDELSAFAYPGESDFFLVTFRQDYRSDNFNSTRYKSQYWRSTDDGWRIVQEGGI